MQQYQVLTRHHAPGPAFLPPSSPATCTSVSSLSVRGKSPLRPLKNRCARQTVARRQRVRILAEQAQPPSESPSDDTRAESTSEAPQDAKEDDFQIEVPNAFGSSGDPGCVQCTGEGEIDCPVCNATGFITLSLMDTVSSSQCRMCMGRRIIPCPTCRQIVFKSVVWWDQIPSDEEDPEEKWRNGPDGPKFGWGGNPAGS